MVQITFIILYYNIDKYINKSKNSNYSLLYLIVNLNKIVI